MSYTLPELDYDYSELEPFISAEIMEIHHKKHHNTYITNLNAALEKMQSCEEKNDLPGMIALESALRFNGGGHINHSLFWKNLAPASKGGGNLEDGPLKKAIEAQFGSLETLINDFTAQTVPIQGSGWGWLGYHKDSDQLALATCANQDPLVMQGLIPLLGIDVWEHAYYLQYKNVRPDYVKAIWNIINWKEVERRYTAAKTK